MAPKKPKTATKAKTSKKSVQPSKAKSATKPKTTEKTSTVKKPTPAKKTAPSKVVSKTAQSNVERKTSPTAIPRGMFYTQHKRLISGHRVVKQKDLRNGMVLEIKYKATYRSRPKTSLYLVIEPKYRGYIHTIDLDYIQPKSAHKFLAYCRGGHPKALTMGRQIFTYLPFMSNGRSLYDLLQNISDVAYRKLNPKGGGLKSMHIVNYQWQKHQPDGGLWTD